MPGCHARQGPDGAELAPFEWHIFHRPARFPAILQSHTCLGTLPFHNPIGSQRFRNETIQSKLPFSLSSTSLRNGPSPAICIRQSNPRRFNSTAALNNRSHRLTGTREPTPTMRTFPPTGGGTLWDCSKSRPLRTTNTCLGTKKLCDRRHV